MSLKQFQRQVGLLAKEYGFDIGHQRDGQCRSQLIVFSHAERES